MKIKYLFILLLFCFSFSFIFATDMPSFPMSIYGEIKIGDELMSDGVIKIYNNNFLLFEYDISSDGKYGAFNVSDHAIVLAEFGGSLDFSIVFDGDEYDIDQITKNSDNSDCPESDNIVFVSQNCRYNFVLEEKEEEKSSGGGGGGGGGYYVYPEDDEDEVQDDEEGEDLNSGVEEQENGENNKKVWKIENIKPVKINQTQEEKVEEKNEAYNFIKSKGITTTESIEIFNWESTLVRKHLAKMISQFAVEVMGKEEMTGGVSGCESFEDMEGETEEMQKYATMSCKLGLMGWEGDQKTTKANFNPNQEVTRAHFGTILSRLIRGNKYAAAKGQDYYSNHLEALKNSGILSKITPEMNELRGRVALMLYRVGG